MFRSPTFAGLPPIEFMLADIPATPKQIAAHLGITEATLGRYKRTGNAPRSVYLALFWETRWGRSAADTEAHNAAVTHGSDARALRDELGRMRGVVARLEREIELCKQDGRAANLPIWRAA